MRAIFITVDGLQSQDTFKIPEPPPKRIKRCISPAPRDSIMGTEYIPALTNYRDYDLTDINPQWIDGVRVLCAIYREQL